MADPIPLYCVWQDVKPYSLSGFSHYHCMDRLNSIGLSANVLSIVFAFVHQWFCSCATWGIIQSIFVELFSVGAKTNRSSFWDQKGMQYSFAEKCAKYGHKATGYKMQPEQKCELFRINVGLFSQFSNVFFVFWLQLDARGKPRVWVCRDKTSGRPRGDGIVGYKAPQAAALAIDRFHSKFTYWLCQSSQAWAQYVSMIYRFPAVALGIDWKLHSCANLAVRRFMCYRNARLPCNC